MAHHIGYDVEGPAFHAAVVEGAEHLLGLAGRHPVVVRACVLFFRQADEGQVLRPRHVCRVAAVDVGIGEDGRVEGLKGRPAGDLFFLYADLDELPHLFFSSLHPVDLSGFVSLACSSTHFSTMPDMVSPLGADPLAYAIPDVANLRPAGDC